MPPVQAQLIPSAAAPNPALMAPAPSQAPASSSPSSSADPMADKLTSFKTVQQFTWRNGPGADPDAVLEMKPLQIGLQNADLSTEEHVNVDGMYLTSLTNKSPVGIGLQVENVNGVNLKKVHDSKGVWATHYVPPGQSHDFHHLNEGKGLALHNNRLPPADLMSNNVVPSDLMREVEVHSDLIDPQTNKPLSYDIPVDLSGFHRDSGLDTAQKYAKMSNAGRIAFTNNRYAFLNYRGPDGKSLEEIVGGQLPGTRQAPEETSFPSMKVMEDSRGTNRARVIARVNADEWLDHVELFKEKLKHSSQKTSPSNHVVRIVRQAQPSSSKGGFGDLRGEPNLTIADVDRLTGQTAGVTAVLHYDVNHNQKKFQQAVAQTAIQKNK